MEKKLNLQLSLQPLMQIIVSPHKMVQQPSGRLDKSYFEHNNTDFPMLELFSSISKEEKIDSNESKVSAGKSQTQRLKSSN